jgi:hypothetical protein
MDNTPRPRLVDLPVTGATVQVYSRFDQCTNGLFVLNLPFLWGRIMDGLDGAGGSGVGCPVVSVGSYKAAGVTDALGNVTIIVPPLAAGPASAYLVIARTDKFDYIKNATSPDTLYSEYTVTSITATQVKAAPLHQLATFNGKIIPAKQSDASGPTWTSSSRVHGLDRRPGTVSLRHDRAGRLGSDDRRHAARGLHPRPAAAVGLGRGYD